MCKKVLIAALAVVVGLVTLGLTSTKVGGLIRLKCARLQEAAARQVTPETEIELINQNLDRLTAEDRRFVDQIVRYDMKVEALHKQVATRRAAVVRLDGEVRDMFVALKTEGERVAFRGTEFSKADMQQQVRLDAEQLQREEAALAADDAQLKELTETRTLYQTRLSDLRAQRTAMRTELQRIRNTLLKERLAQEKGKIANDDGGLATVRRDMDNLKARVQVMTKTRELQGASDEGPVRRAIAEKQRENATDTFLQKRYGAAVSAEGAVRNDKR